MKWKQFGEFSDQFAYESVPDPSSSEQKKSKKETKSRGISNQNILLQKNHKRRRNGILLLSLNAFDVEKLDIMLVNICLKKISRTWHWWRIKTNSS